MGTITKALDLLGYFSRTRPSIGLGEFVRLTGRDKATVHRHLVELEQNGFLEQDSVTRAYRLGPAILRLTSVRESTFPTRAVLRPLVTELSEDLDELVHASMLQGRILSPIFHADPKRHGTQVSFDEAEMQPLHATASGLVVLAFADDALREAVLAGPLAAHTDRTITDPEALRARLVEIRAAGLARAAGGFDTEVASQAAPLFGASGAVIGALSVAMPSGRGTDDRLESFRARLCAGAARATVSLGGTVPPDLAALWAAVSDPRDTKRA
ncbi:IclR family transcriptional regulator [Salipiger sp. IMCC34102]|uniref:IclR family transcriptional regulator n=1 Tax=Salipiger sp. IMCC34102 TaxID=2510647 RepID=UPI00101D5391|nr:IclR family transcriptional regulator [Salipiger sp. IMCC34102]RYH02629.1 IclR family transcriptional regulator [Salipiger sp. IMCC34102]